jgi:23S rRNA pseudouridine2604 synthase
MTNLMPVRLAKRVAELRACSRREAEQIITGGWVRVEGIVVEEPHFRVAEHLIEIDAKADPTQTLPVTLLLHKPCGVPMQMAKTEAATEAEAEQTAQQLLNIESFWPEESSIPGAKKIHPLKIHFTQLSPCAVLETDAAGLVVFSQDWRIVRKLTEEAATVEHEIVAEVKGELTPAGLKRLNQGITFQGRPATAAKVSWQNETRLRIALKGAKLGQVMSMLNEVDLEVIGLKRIRLGGVSMGKLPAGNWRYLRSNERF